MATLKTNPFSVGLANIDTTLDNKLRTYTPLWFSTAVQPALNDGTISGWYTTKGDFIRMSVSLLMGAGTTYGTGTYGWTLPFGTSSTAAREATGTMWIFDSSANTYYTGVCRSRVNSNSIIGNVSGAVIDVSPASPMVWAAADKLILTIEFPIR